MEDAHEYRRNAARRDWHSVTSGYRKTSEIKEQGVVFRKYVPLKTFELGRNELPYTNEWRFFFFGTTLLSVGYYWSVGDCFRQAELTDDCLAKSQKIAQIASRFATFFTLDLAETQEGDWILIEINDAVQMADPRTRS